MPLVRILISNSFDVEIIGYLILFSLFSFIAIIICILILKSLGKYHLSLIEWYLGTGIISVLGMLLIVMINLIMNLSEASQILSETLSVGLGVMLVTLIIWPVMIIFLLSGVSFLLDLYGGFGEVTLSEQMFLFLLFYSVLSQYLSLIAILLNIRSRLSHLLTRSRNIDDQIVDI